MHGRKASISWLCFYKKKSLKLRHSSDLSDLALVQVHESMDIS